MLTVARFRPVRGPTRSSPLAFPVAASLGYAGGVMAYLPLLTLLLPLKIERIAGADRFYLLAAASCAGAVTAGATNILFGWLSDCSLHGGRGPRTAGRRRWIAAGLVAMLASYGGIAQAESPLAIIVAVVAFQAALNAVLAPLMALIAEEGTAAHKGLVGGLFAAGPPAASLLCPLLVRFVPASLGVQLALVGAAVMACLVPLLVGRWNSDDTLPALSAPRTRPRRDFALAWVARLLVQIAGNVMFVYLLYFMEGFAAGGQRGEVAAQVSNLILLASVAPLPVAVLLGRWADRHGRRRIVLAVTAIAAAVGLVVMALTRDWTAAAIAFCAFSIGWGSFMPLQVGFVMQMLPDPRHRGRDLGIMNLANVLPVLIGQVLALLLARPGDIAALLAMLAALTLEGGLVMLGVAGEPAGRATGGTLSRSPESR